MELIHFSNSSSQFFTSEHGHTTMQRFASGFPCESLFLRREYISVIDCSVLLEAHVVGQNRAAYHHTGPSSCRGRTRRRRSLALAPVFSTRRDRRRRRAVEGLIFDAIARWCGRSHWQSNGGRLRRPACRPRPRTGPGVRARPRVDTRGDGAAASRLSRYAKQSSRGRVDGVTASTTRHLHAIDATREGGLGRRTDGRYFGGGSSSSMASASSGPP